MANASRAGVVLLSMCAAGCPGGSGSPGIKIPAPTQPKLETVRLVGNRVCAPFTTGERTFDFTCPALPTINASGWQLTPERVPPTANPQRLHSNRVVVLTVSGPSLTEIDVELVRPGTGANFPLTPVDSNRPGLPGEVATAREVGVRASDDGTKKTWQIDVNVSMCAFHRTLQVFNHSSASPSRSNPLEVTLLRASDERMCAETPGTGPGGGPFWQHEGAAPGHPTNPQPTGPCAGGAARQLFHVCENCASFHPAELNDWSAGEYCSWQDVLDTYGYSTGSKRSAPCTRFPAARRARAHPERRR
jgi:hypothetical protein